MLGPPILPPVLLVIMLSLSDRPRTTVTCGSSLNNFPSAMKFIYYFHYLLLVYDSKNVNSRKAGNTRIGHWYKLCSVPRTKPGSNKGSVTKGWTHSIPLTFPLDLGNFLQLCLSRSITSPRKLPQSPYQGTQILRKFCTLTLRHFNCLFKELTSTCYFCYWQYQSLTLILAWLITSIACIFRITFLHSTLHTLFT